jgi:FkbM family methyltransferase
MNTIDNIPAWGTYAPGGMGKLLVLARRLGLARGAFKKTLARLWAGLRLPVPVDIRYAGLKFRLHPWDNVVENKMLFGSKLRDGSEIRKLEAFSGKGGVFLDIGANIGYYALMAAHQGAARVLAFEPNPTVYDRLRFNIEANDLNGRIAALPIALGDRVATLNMAVTDRDLGGSHLGDAGARPGTSISVQVQPLAKVLAQEGITGVDAMKIDVEGMEDAVLFPFFETSARRSWPRLVIIEHTSQKQWKRDILAWMRESGYREVERNRSNAILQLTEP